MTPPSTLRPRGQSGLGTLEIVLACTLGFFLAAGAGMIFRNQVRHYLDIRDQARVQADLKLARQAMTRLIGNAGACLPNPRSDFSAAEKRLAFAYVDLPGRHCAASTRVKVSFYAATAGGKDRLLQDIACGSAKARTRTLLEAPQGSLRLAFRYYDRRGQRTTQASQIKAVDLDLSLQTASKAGKGFQKTRGQVNRIQCANL